MAVRLQIPTLSSINQKERTTVDTSASSGATTITLTSAQGIGANDYVLIGSIGQEQTELKLVSSISGDTLTLNTALSYAHDENEPVYALRGNQVQIYSGDDVDGKPPSDSSFSSVATIDIDPDGTETEYLDSSGDTDTWYKWTFYNSTTNSENTNLNEVKAIRGRYHPLYAKLSEVRQEAGLLNNKYITDNQIAGAVNDAQSEIDSTLTSMYSVPFSDPAPEIISRITVELSAGFLLLMEFGASATGTNRDGDDKVTRAREQLEKIKNGEKEITDAQGNSLVSSSVMKGWPNDSTKDADGADGGGERMFRATQEF